MSLSNAGMQGLKPGVCTSTTRPTNPYLGQLIFETDTFAMLFWNGSAWQGAISAPAGTVNPFAGSTAPTGWLLCGGQNVSRTTYAGLFAVIGTTYGAGDGSTTFALPDLRGRVVAGEDDMGGTAANRLTAAESGITGTTLGAAGGVQSVTLTAAQSGVPGHNHPASSGNDSPDHSHGPGLETHFVTVSTQTVGTLPAGNVYQAPYNKTTSTGGASARHSHSITVSNNTAANASSSHSNTQPTIVLNYIIKF